MDNSNGDFTNDQEGMSAYLDLRSAMLENEKKQRLLEHMVEQQIKLRNLQERQNALLKAQNQVSNLDYVATSDLHAKLKRLQSVKGRIMSLQNLVDDAETSTSSVQASQSIALNGSGDDFSACSNGATKNDVDTNDASALVNEQLEKLYDTVSNLLSDIDDMNTFNTFVDDQEKAAIKQISFAKEVEKNGSPAGYKVPVSPLPFVNLVDKDAGDAKRSSPAKPQRFKHDGSFVDRSFVQRHYKVDAGSQTKSSSESSFDEQNATSKTTTELWAEMRKYQTQLAQLQERRRELSTYIQSTQGNREEDGSFSDVNDEDSDSIKAPSDSGVVKFKLAKLKKDDIPLKYFLGQTKPDLDATTEKTNATWGGSTSTSGDESVGFISKPVEESEKLNISEGDEEFGEVTASIEEHVYDLWDALDYHNNFLHILLDDQKALSILLQNTLSLQKDHHINAVLYGISPDFLIYQLDNCSSQIMAYQKHIVMLHKELSEIQKLYPEIDISYNLSKAAHRYYVQNDNMTVGDNSELYSPDRGFARSLSSTPLKYYSTRSMDRPSSKLGMSYYSPSPLRSFKTQPAFRSFPGDSLKLDNSSFEMPIKSVPQVPSLGDLTSPNYKRRPFKMSPRKSLNSSLQPGDMSGIAIPQSKLSPPQSEQQPLNKSSKKTTTRVSKASAKTEISDIDSNASGFPLFEALRDSIYSEAATLISQNEARPHFLIELFHELQQLNSDYLRQHCLFVIRDVVNGYLTETPKKTPRKKTAATQSTPPSKTSPISKSAYVELMSDMKTLYSENTPSESAAESDDDNLEIRLADGNALHYDYVLDVSSASDMTTPLNSQEYSNDVQNPFEADYLGSTVIHLDEALRRVREMEQLKQDKSDQDKQEDDTDKEAAPVKLESESNPQSDVLKLDGKIKYILAKIFPVVKSQNEVCDENKIREICTLVSQLVSSDSVLGEDSKELSDKQLQSVLSQCLNKFIGYHLSECGEELVIDISEVLFNELAYIYMIKDYNDAEEEDSKIDEIEEDVCEQEDRSEMSDLNEEECESSSSSLHIVEEDDDDENGDAKISKPADSSNHDKSNSSVVVDLSVSESKPLTSYGSGEDEEAGSGDEYDQYNETDDVPTSIQHDQSCPPNLPPKSDIQVAEQN